MAARTVGGHACSWPLRRVSAPCWRTNIDVQDITLDCQYQSCSDPGSTMITAAQLRAARALLGIDQQTLADMAGVSLPTIQRMEASQGNVRGVIDTLIKVVEALNAAGVELLGDNARSDGGGRGVRLREPAAAAVRASPPASSRARKGRGRT
jgi:transcriptional regulator with XRE-family HTH domain